MCPKCFCKVTLSQLRQWFTRPPSCTRGRLIPAWVLLEFLITSAHWLNHPKMSQRTRYRPSMPALWLSTVKGYTPYFAKNSTNPLKGHLRFNCCVCFSFWVWRLFDNRRYAGETWGTRDLVRSLWFEILSIQKLKLWRGCSMRPELKYWEGYGVRMDTFLLLYFNAIGQLPCFRRL